MYDGTFAGGVSAILREISKKKGLIDGTCMTVTGKTIAKNIARAKFKDSEVVHSLNNPYSADGGLTILHGNLAEQGAVV